MNKTASKERELPKRGKKPTPYRRIVTGNVNRKSVVQSDEPLLAYEFKTAPGARNLASLKEDQIIHENNLVTVGRLDGNAYKSSQAAELTLNAAILRAEIARSYEEFLEILDKYYADDVEVSSEDSPETIRGRERVRPFLLNFLVPLHVMAEVAGLSISVQHSEVPRDTADETYSGWRIDFAGVGGSRCTLKWSTIRRWKASRVVYEHHYDHEQIGGPLTEGDLNLDWRRSGARLQLPS
jgi:hypothetical protein